MDGDQVTGKVAYSNEANKELTEYMNSKSYYIGLDGVNIRNCSNEAIQSLFTLSMKLPENNVTPDDKIQ